MPSFDQLSTRDYTQFVDLFCGAGGCPPSTLRAEDQLGNSVSAPPDAALLYIYIEQIFCGTNSVKSS
jgi:hypothetical protein